MYELSSSVKETLSPEEINEVVGSSMRDLDLLMMVATYSENALEVPLLFEEIEKTQVDLVFILGEIAEGRSKETSNHVKRVGEYCYRLAKFYGLNESECKLIRIASPLHDVGKLAVPDSILNKTGPLTEDEFEIMKEHSNRGFNMLNVSKRRILQAGAIIAKTHQEKYDGTGYPDKLKGDDIPL